MVEKIKVKINGHSMKPILNDGDLVECIPVQQDTQPLSRFDIVIFKMKDHYLCHYIWDYQKIFTNIVNPVIITRPLNPISAYDFPINQSDIIGIVKTVKISNFQKAKVYLVSIWSHF